jgi:hypothetical protein
MKSVYSAVRTGDLNKAVCALSFNGQAMQQGEKLGQLDLEINAPVIQNTSHFTPNNKLTSKKILILNLSVIYWYENVVSKSYSKIINYTHHT